MFVIPHGTGLVGDCDVFDSWFVTMGFAFILNWNILQP